MRSPSPSPELRRLVEELSGELGPSRVLAADDTKASYEHDWTRRFGGTALCVARPHSTDDVIAVVNACRRSGVALVAQGGRTGLVGGSVPRDDGRQYVVMSTLGLDWIDEVDELSGQVTCGAGASLASVHAAAAACGLRYGVDFGSRAVATIGGTLATNAGGHHVLAFGTTRNQVLGVEAVMANGTVVSRLSGLEKDNTGYDLAGLLIGSEGTLGVITAVRLRLRPRPRSVVTALVAMSSLGATVDAVRSLRSDVPGLVAAEFMLDSGVDLVCRALDLPAPSIDRGRAVLLVEAEGSDEDALVETLAHVLGQLNGVVDAAVATTRHDRERLWSYRDRHSEAVATLGVPHKLDITVPLNRLATFVERLPELTAPHHVVVWGHVGDGNVHVNVIGPEAADDDVDRAVLEATVEADGAISGEHGIGVAKAELLSWDRSPGDLQLMASIKSAVDPGNVMNPGVLLDQRLQHAAPPIGGERPVTRPVAP